MKEHPPTLVTSSASDYASCVFQETTCSPLNCVSGAADFAPFATRLASFTTYYQLRKEHPNDSQDRVD